MKTKEERAEGHNGHQGRQVRCGVLNALADAASSHGEAVLKPQLWLSKL